MSEKPVNGTLIKSPLQICARNLDKPMYPLILNLCYYCQKNSSEKDIFETASGRWYIQIILCSKCVEFNIASQEAGRKILQKHITDQSL